MGWTYSPSWRSKDELVRYLKSPERNGEHYQILASTVRGQRHWYVARYQKDGQDITFIGLDLMQSGREDGWGYKAMDESVHPYYYDCPLKFLDMVSEPHGSAAEWRAKVREHHQKKAARPQWEAGMIVTFGGYSYRLESPYAPRKGWSVTRMGDGQRFRMPASYLNRATLEAGA
jgi:hypothetical protein